MNSILVTGANGFIGNALCPLLLNRGYGVRAVSRSILDSNSETSGIEKFRICDIGPETEWRNHLKGVKYVIHLAARVHFTRGTENGQIAEYQRVNVQGTIRLAKQAHLYGVKRLIYLSSIKVNGEENRSGFPFYSTDIPSPKGYYALSKHEAEKELINLAESTGMEVVIIRPPLVYGPGVKANFLKLMQLLDYRIPLPLGSVNNMRSFVGIDNLIDLITVCLEHPAASGKILLAGDGEDLSTTELLKRLGSAMGKKPIIFPVKPEFLEKLAVLVGQKELSCRLLKSLQVDISRTKRLLDWNPTVSVDECLQKTAKDYLKRR